VNAQTIDIQYTITNASSSTSCDGQLDVQCAGCSAPVNYSWYDSTNTLIGTGTHISGLCTNQYYLVNISPYNSCQPYLLAGGINDATIFGATFQSKTSLHYGNNSVVDSLIIQQVSGGFPPYTYGINDDTVNITTGYSFTSISNVVLDSFPDPNTFYTFFVGDSTYANYVQFYFKNILDTGNFCNQNSNPLWVSAQGYPTSDSVTCDGWAYATVHGGTPPYTYHFSSGSTDTITTGLCAGSYFVTVKDADSNIFNTTFVIGYPGTFYFSDPNSFNYIDTLYSNAAMNCGLDFSIPVDSFYIDSSYAISNWAYTVNWVILQDTNTFDFSETYYIDTTGDYLFGLSVYCDARSSTFDSYNFFAGAHIDMLGVTTQVKELKKDNSVSIYPNPSNGIYNLKTSSKMKEYSIYDPLGRMVVHKRINSDYEVVNISELNNGMYYFVVQFVDNTIGRRKFIKK